MTRINVGVHPSELPDKFLLAENHEILRIPMALIRGKYNLSGMPEKFTLGKGHVKFFYKRMTYLYLRYLAILSECKKRGFQTTDYSGTFALTKALCPWAFVEDFRPEWRDREIILQRFKEKGFEL